ncbi:hypothetical protein RD792_002134 [Penstemon davidsonii]|uniref:Factor of DNA methylation 1-5/IDN2 domain-containing protein n=1 Tax=Penstemon davidsonii TaxID=160366 RepID=A0ABR0DQY0_9LAMI|nr:hypothetical protein RD792_002134 [Penstemon davidsonii]
MSLGKKLFQEVTTALMEMNEYNPSGMYVIPDKDDRRATLKEGVLNLMNQWSLVKNQWSKVYEISSSQA